MAALNGYPTEVQIALAGLDEPAQRAIIEELRGHLEDRERHCGRMDWTRW